MRIPVDGNVTASFPGATTIAVPLILLTEPDLVIKLFQEC